MTAGDIIKWGLIGFAGWWVYETFFAAPSTAAATTTTTGTTTTPATTTPATTTTAPTPTAAAGSFKTLDAMYAALLAAAQAAMPGSGGAITSSGGVLSADGDVWNYYLSQVDPSIDTSQLDPTVIFGSTITSANRSTPVTSSAYWAAAGPIIGKQTGLSGYLHGLGAIVYGGRRRRRVA